MVCLYPPATAPAPATRRAGESAIAAVIAAEHHDVAHQRQVRALDLAHARAGAFFHAIAGVEILLMHHFVHFAALHHGEAAILHDALGHHGLDALADVHLGAEDGLHRCHYGGIIERIDGHRLLLLSRSNGGARPTVPELRI